MKTVSLPLVALCLLCGAHVASATNVEGMPDPFFGFGGYRLIDFPTQPNRTDFLYGVAVTADQRIVTAGTVNVGPGNNSIGVSRLLADGGFDSSFGVGAGYLVVPGSLKEPGAIVQAYALALQSDGKIVVAGSYGSSTTQANEFLVLRMRADGSGVDATFGTNGFVVVPFNLGGDKIDVATSIAIQSDGKIVVAGGARLGATDSDIAVVRLLTNGALDASFDVDGKKTIWFDLGGAGNDNFDVANALTIQPDGKILVAGSATTPTGRDCVVARLASNGSLDATFGNLSSGKSRVAFSSARDDEATAIAFSQSALDSNGTSRRIVIAGSADAWLGGTEFAVAVLTENGQLDSAFSGDGKLTIPFNLSSPTADSANALVIQTGWTSGPFKFPYRKIVLGGGAYSSAVLPHFEYALARLGFDGTLDSTFGTGGKSHFTYDVDADSQPNGVSINGMAVQGNQLVIGGNTNVRRFAAPADADFILGRVLLDD
ncbi:MAG: hypothetical protein ABI411_10210 [Tahibacter sp.]